MRRAAPLALLPWLLAAVARGAPDPTPEWLVLRRSIPLGKVEGRLDHLAIDAAGKRLVLAALGNGSVEVVDLERGKVVRSLGGLARPQGIAILPDTGRIAVASGGDGTLRVFEGTTFAPLAPVPLGEDADNVRLEPGTGRLLVGYGAGGIAVVAADRVAASVPLPAHPESFQLEAGGPRVFVNLPDAGQVAVVDRARAAVVAAWPVTQARRNYPMAFDEPRQRLLIGCREPPRLLVLDASPGAREPGRVVASLEISGDVDDVHEDPARGRVYLSCGEGFVDVVERREADRYERIGRVATAPGARTSLFAPATSSLYVAVPRRGEQAAEVREYGVR